MGFDIVGETGRVHFDVWTWPLVLELAESRGWQPAGTDPPPPVYAPVPADDAEAVAEALELAGRVQLEHVAPGEARLPMEVPAGDRRGDRRWILCEAHAADLWGGTYVTIQRQQVRPTDASALAAALERALTEWATAAERLQAAREALDQRLRTADAGIELPQRRPMSSRDAERLRHRIERLVALLRAGPVRIA